MLYLYVTYSGIYHPNLNIRFEPTLVQQRNTDLVTLGEGGEGGGGGLNP